MNDFKAWWKALPMQSAGNRNTRAYANTAWKASRESTLDEIGAIAERKYNEAIAVIKNPNGLHQKLVQSKANRLNSACSVLKEVIEELEPNDQ